MAILNDLLVNGISRFIGGVIIPATNVTSSTTYYPVLATGTSTSLFVDTDKSGLSFIKVDGTTGAEGTATLTLGNTTQSGTAGNTTGRLILRDYYGVSATIAPRAGGGRSDNTMMYLPNWSGSAEYLISNQSSSAVGGANQPVYVDASGHVQACNTYAGGTAVTLNGTSKAASTASFYAPTSAGTSGYVLTSSGSGAPTWLPSGSGTPYIDLGSATLSAGTPTTTGTSYTLTFATATTALSSVTAPTIVMFTTIIDTVTVAFVGQYTKDLVVSPTTFKQIVGTCVMGNETKTFKVSIVPSMTTGTLLVDDVANIWRKATSGGIVFFNEGVDISDYQVGDIIDIGKDIPTSVITTDDGSNRLIIGPGTTQFGNGLSASVDAGSTSYEFSSAWKLAPNGSTDVDFLKDIYFYIRGQNVAAQKPIDAQVVNGKVTLTFSSSLNPISAATGIWGSCYSQGYNSLLIGTGVSQVGGAISIICAMATKTSGFYNSIVGQSIENSGSASSIVAVRAKNTGNYSAIVGSDLVNAKNYATLFGLGHDSTSGPAAVTAVGQYSDITSTTLFAVGKGTAANARSNAFEVTTTGTAKVIGLQIGAASEIKSIGTGLAIDANGALYATGGGGSGTVDSARSTSSTNALQNSVITNFTQTLPLPVYAVAGASPTSAITCIVNSNSIVGDKIMTQDGWIGTISSITNVGGIYSASATITGTNWMAPRKVTVGTTQYTITRKALEIVDGSTTTTYYVADITS